MSAGDARGRKGVEGGGHRVDGDVAGGAAEGVGGAGFEGSEAGRAGERRAEGGGAEQADPIGGRERVGARRKRGQVRTYFGWRAGAVPTMRSSQRYWSAPTLTRMGEW